MSKISTEDKGLTQGITGNYTGTIGGAVFSKNGVIRIRRLKGRRRKR